MIYLMLSEFDIKYFKNRTDAVSIYHQNDLLSGKDLNYNKEAQFEDLKSVPQEIISNRFLMEKLVGEHVLLQYPDSSSWSQTYHIEYVSIDNLLDCQDENDYLIVFKSLIEKNVDEKYMFYHESFKQFLSGTEWYNKSPKYKIWISSYLYESLISKS